MRPRVLGVLLAAGIAGAAGTSHAQTPYNYSWCGTYPGRTYARSCYYNSYEQCIATMRTAGGFCTQNPAYVGPATGTAQGRPKRRPNRS
jgi:hypothetical protein